MVRRSRTRDHGPRWLENRRHDNRFLGYLDGEALAPSTGRQAVVEIPAFSIQEELGFYARHPDHGATKLDYPVADTVVFPTADEFAKSLQVLFWTRCSTGTMTIDLTSSIIGRRRRNRAVT